MNIADAVMAFLFQNIFYIVLLGLVVYFAFLYLRFGRKTTYKVIDREEVERQKFIDAMQFNKRKDIKSLWKGEIILPNGSNAKARVLPMERIGNIENYLEFSQVPIKLSEIEGKITYTEVINEKSMDLIAITIKPTIFLGISNPFKKSQPLLLEKDTTYKVGKTLVIPRELGIEKMTGIFYVINENTRPKIRNVIDARILVQDWNLTCSRYFAKGQEQAVYSPEVAQTMMQLEKQLQIQLAKTKGKEESI